MRIIVALSIVLLSISLSAQSTWDSLYHAAEKKMQAYQFEAAADDWANLNALVPDSILVLSQWGYALQQTGKHREAMALFEQVLLQDSLHLYAWNRLAHSQQALGQSNQVIQTYQQLLQLDSTNAYYHAQLAKRLEKTNDIGLAFYHYARALHYQNDNPDLYVSLGSLLLQLEQANEADSLAHEGLRLDSNHILLLKLRSQSLYQLKDYAGVITVQDRLFPLGDTSAAMAKIRGVSAFYEKDYPGSIDWLEWILQQQQTSEVVLYYLGLAYRELDQYDLATQYLEMAVQEGMSENLSHYYTQLGVAYEENNNHPAAIRAFQKAYELSKRKLILYHLARNYDQYYGDKSTALRYYERYLEENDTANEDYMNYSQHRVGELKELRHLSVD